MKKILSLCINLLLFIISDAVPLKLIAGDRTVVKKDGATHTISKYYVVPNDFEANNITNNKEASQATLRMNHSLYSKSMNADTTSEGQVSKNNAETANNQTKENKADVNNIDVNLRSGLTDVQVDVATQADDNPAKSTGSLNTEQSLDPDDLGNLQVKPITNSITINGSVPIAEIKVYNSSEALQNGTTSIVKNASQTFERDVEDELDDLILTKFSIAVRESSVQNLESFWKIIKLTKDRISDDDDLLAKIERLSLLLNIFTNLYEAAQLQKPIEPMIDSIIDILQIPFVGKRNTNEPQSQTSVSGDYDEECLRKSGQKLYRPQLDSNGTYLSETETLEASDNLGLDNLELQRRQNGDSDHGDDSVNTSNDPGSNKVTVSNQPTYIQRSHLLVPNNLSVGVPDGFNVRSSILTFNHVSRHNDVQEDPQSNQTIPDSTDIDQNLDDQPMTIESRLTDDLPWHIEDKKNNYQPWIIKHRTTNTLPWTIEDKGTQKVPWKVKYKADPNRTIENKNWHLPITLNQSRNPSVTTHSDKNILNQNKSMTGTVHSVKNGVKRPYHVYTYVISPETSLGEIPNLGNIVKVKSRQPNDKLRTKLYGLSTSHGGNKILYTNKPSLSYYDSKFSLSEPSVDISRPIDSQLKHKNHVTAIYDTSDEVNPSDLFSGTTQDDYQPTSETNHKPVLLKPNTHPSDPQTNLNVENYTPTVPEADSHPGVLVPNVPAKPFASLKNLGNTLPVFLESASASADSSNVNPDVEDRYHNPYNPNINLNFMQQTDYHPSLISKASSYSEYTHSLDDYDEPNPVYGGHTGQHPGMISTSSSSSAYTNLPDEYNKPAYGGQTDQRLDLISSSALANSEYINVAHRHDEPNRVYGGQAQKYPGFISKASAHSKYTNIPNDYNNPIPDYGQDTDRHPGLISKIHHYPEYVNIVDDYDEPIPVNGGQTHKHSGFISEATSHSEFTNVPNDNNNPTPNYEENIVRYPIHIKKPVNGRPTEIEDKSLVSYHPYIHTVHITQPSFIAHLHRNQPTGLNYLQYLKLKLPPTYRLFTFDNLLKLHDLVIKTIEVNGDEPGVYDNRALINFRKIINIILILAEHLEEPEGSIEWYEKIFYNTQKNRHPLEVYVYNLIRQRWLHELMLVLYKNEFNFDILQNLRIFSFLGSWQFPDYVLNFMKTEEPIHNFNFDAPEFFDQTFSTQHGLNDKFATHTYDDLLEEVPEDLENYVTNHVIDSYKTPNAGIVLSIAGVEAEPDANAIINILKKYLHYKSFIEKQENVFIRDNKVKMFKQIILFLRERGYNASTIADLIKKLYTAVYSNEGKDCQVHHTNFAKNMYDVILPVLRRSGP